MNPEKTVAEMEDEEKENFTDAVKYARFEEWIEKTNTDEAKAELNKILEHTGLHIGSPLLMMITAFFAGFDAGADVMATLEKMEGE